MGNVERLEKGCGSFLIKTASNKGEKLSQALLLLCEMMTAAIDLPVEPLTGFAFNSAAPKGRCYYYLCVCKKGNGGGHSESP